MSKFRESRDKGSKYLLSQVKPDGFVGDPSEGVAGYYKPLWALQSCGETKAANRLCDWVRKDGITPEGDFGPRPDFFKGPAHLYPNAWTVIAAQRLGQFDIAQRGMDFIARQWDSETGGFFGDLDSHTAETQQETMVTSFCGQAAIYTGRIDIAEGVGRWAKTVFEAQPDFPARLYTNYTRAGGLVTDYPTEDEIGHVVIASAARDQAFFQPGVTGAFLARLYQATGNAEWLDLAKEYMHFAEGANDYLFHIVRAGKVGWAASLLYTLSGESRWRDMAVRVGNNLIDLQFQGGFWSGVGGHQPSIDSTAERVAWMDEIDQAVGEL